MPDGADAPDAREPGSQRSTTRFGVATAVTRDYVEMAAGMLAALRLRHPDIDLFIYTDESGENGVKRLADAFSAADFIVQRPLPYECGDWNRIVTVKFDVFGRRYPDPLMYLDTDQILYRDLSPFVDAFARSGATLAGSPDDESFVEQFLPGAAPADVAADAPAINTGAFIVRTDPRLHRRIVDSLSWFSGRGRLPTQSVINGIAQMDRLPMLVFGEEFMCGPFSRRVLDDPRTTALIHLWTPRPPFMTPNPVRRGETPYAVLKAAFAERFGADYPEARLEREYRSQLADAARFWQAAS